MTAEPYDLNEKMAELASRRKDLARFNDTDLGNAERLATLHGHQLRYVPNVGWHVWDQKRWRVDEDGAVNRCAGDTVRQIAHTAIDTEDTDRRKSLAKWAHRSEAHSRLAAMIDLAESDAALVARVDDLDSDPWLLNCANGTVDLQTGEISRHDQHDLITKLAPVAYDAGATAPLWVEFLERIFAGNQDLIAFLQRAAGYSLTGSTGEQVMFLLHGRGANGKSTFLEMLAEAIGDYAQQAPSDLLMQARVNRGGATPDLARLPGARFVSAVETGEGRRLDEPLVKQITGGDRIAARRLYRDVFEFTPTHKLWLGTNHLPQIGGTDEAIWRRIRLVPFTVQIPEPERDKHLKEKLHRELPGILAWAVRGCLDYLGRGLDEPSEVRDATASYREEMDDLGAFLEECATIAETITAQADGVKAAVLFTSYEYWAKANGAAGMSATAFGRQLAERGFQKQKKADGWHYLGVTLNNGDQQSLN